MPNTLIPEFGRRNRPAERLCTAANAPPIGRPALQQPRLQRSLTRQKRALTRGQFWLVAGCSLALAGLGLWVLTGASAGQDIWPPLFLAVLAAYAVIRSLIWLFLGIGGGDGEGLDLWSGSSDGGDSSDGGGGDGGD